MLHRVNGVRALSVLCIFNILGQCRLQSIPFSLLSQVPTAYDGCEEMQTFINMLKSMPAQQAFTTLTLPLARASTPPKIRYIRRQLLEAITRCSLPIQSILHDLGHVRNHNRYDLLITTLMAINEYGNINCALQDNINKVLVYLLKQKYLYKADPNGEDTFGTCTTQSLRSNQLGWSNFKTNHNIHSGGSATVISNRNQDPLCFTTTRRGRPYFNRFNVGSHQRYMNNKLVHLNRLRQSTRRQLIRPTVPHRTIQLVDPVKQIFQRSRGQYNINQNKLRSNMGCSHNFNIRPPFGLNQQYTPTQTSSIAYGFRFNGRCPDHSSHPFHSKMVRLNRFQGHDSGSITTNGNFLKSWSGNSRKKTGSFIQNEMCTCQKQLFEIMLNKILELERRVSQVNIASHSLRRGGMSGEVSIKVDPRISPPPVSKFQFNVDDLLKVIPQPKYPKEQVMYNKFKHLLHSEQVQRLISSMDLSKYHDSSEMLEAILVTISKSVTITSEIEEIIAFFMRFKEVNKANFNYGNFITFIPKPLNSKEVLYYNTFKNYLISQEIYSIVNSEEFKTMSNMGFKFLNVLQQLSESSKISSSLREIVNFYIPIVNARVNNIRYDDLISLLPMPKSQQDLVKYNMIRQFLRSNDIYIAMHNSNVSTATSRLEVLNMVLRRLISNPLSTELQLVATYYRNLLVFQKFGYNYFNLLKLVSASTENLQHLQNIERYMYTTSFQNILLQLQNLRSMSDFDKLLLILTTLEANTSINVQIINSAKYLLLNLNQTRFFQSMEKITHLFPRPKNQDENQMLTIISQYLHTEAAYQLLHNLDATLFSDNKFLIEYILRTICEANVSVEVKEASKYFLNLSEKLETLEFVTKKEIKKNFQLHEIFTDALDLQKLSIPQKDALKKFFRYLSSVKPQIMSGFDSWDAAKTRWQFVKLMFKYFLEKSPAPADILASIRILDPIVKQDGRAALPP